MTVSLKLFLATLVGLFLGMGIMRLMPSNHSEAPELEDKNLKKSKTIPNISNVVCTNRNSSCCDTISFCAISVDELKAYVGNYQDNNWHKSSKYYDRARITYNENTRDDFTMREEIHNDNFDAGFMDISIREMENYICAVKSSVIESNQGQTIRREMPNTLRFYYITYYGGVQKDTLRSDFLDYDDAYNYKHSLALVPVIKNQSSSRELLSESELFSSSLIWAPSNSCQESTTANHNEICPPLLGCEDGTILEEVYTEDRAIIVQQP